MARFARRFRCLLYERFESRLPLATVIAFSRYNGVQYDLFTVNPDGTGEVQLINDSANDNRPAWTRDGTKLAFQRATTGTTDIFAMNRDGTGLTQLTTNASIEFDATFSPDGSKIAFTSNRSGEFEIWVMNADGTGQVQLGSSPASQQDTKPAWSPDGAKIAFTRQISSSQQVWVMNADGTGATQLTSSGNNQEPDWSPDGAKIVFQSTRNGNNQIYSMNANGSSQTRLTNNATADENPVYSPDGTKIAFNRLVVSDHDLVVMNAAGGGETTIATTGQYNFQAAWGIVPPTPTTTVSLAGSVLTIDDTQGGDTNDALTISLDTAPAIDEYVISDPSFLIATTVPGGSGNGTNTVRVPITSITSIVVNALAGNDTLTLNFSGGNVVPASGITFNGGAGTDSLSVTGGTTTSVAHHFTNANDGGLVLTGSLAGTISYTGLEPVTDNLSASDRTFTFNGGAETVTVTDHATAGMTSIDSTLGEIVHFTNPTNSLTINAGTGNDIVTLTSIDAAFNASLTINGGVGDDTVNFNSNADITFAANKNLDLDLENDDAAPGVDAIVFNGSALTFSGTGAATLKASQSVTLGASTITTANGGITLAANVAGTAVGGTVGVKTTFTTISSANGPILLEGTGGTSGTETNGVFVRANTIIQSTGVGPGAATITIRGKGGTVGTAFQTFDAGTLITSVSGAIDISGVGGPAAGGVWLHSATVSSTGTGANAAPITITGSSGIGHAVYVQWADVVTVNAPIQITGTAGINGNVGAWIAGSTVRSTTGNINVTGTGGGQSLDYAVDLTGHNSLQTGGDIVVTGIRASPATNPYGIYMNGSVTTAPGGGDVTFFSDAYFFSGSTSNVYDNTITFRPLTPGTLVTFGGSDTATTLGLTDIDLDGLSVQTLVVGDATTGAMTVLGPMTRPSATNMQLVTAGDITISGLGSLNTAGGSLLLDPGNSPAAVKPTHAGVDVTVSTVSIAGDLALAINGVTVDTQYHQLNVVGQVNLTGTGLVLSGSYVPTAPQLFTLVNNDGADPIVGTFNGLPEGASIANFLGSGFEATITYRGGDGNDVVLLSQPTTLWVTSFTPTATGARFTLSDPAAIVDVLNLYDYRDSGGNFVLGPTDVTLVGATVGEIRGSLTVEPGDTAFRFVASNGVLPPDNYTFTLRSAADGFRMPIGVLLDGNADGVGGDNYVNTFSISAAANPVVVSLPHFSRGPQQPVNVPATSALGLPIMVSNGAGLTSLAFDLSVDVGLLDVTGVSAVSGTASLTTLPNGAKRVTLNFAAPLAAGPQTVGHLSVMVKPEAASRYGERSALDISAIALTPSAGLTAIDGDALHVNAYFGDAGRNGRYDSFDVQQASRLAVRLDTGFQQHPLLDPSILADFNGNGRVDSFDVQRLSRLSLRLPVPETPELPNPLPTTTDTDRLTDEEPPKIEPAKPISAPRADIDGNGAVDAQDVLWAVYYFSRSSNGAVPEAPQMKFDLNGDQQFDPADVLLAIRDFNAGRAAEGESSPAETAIEDAAEELDALTSLLATDLVTARKRK